MSEASISDGPGGAKRPRIYSVSPNKKIDQLQKLPGGACAKCKQDLGPDSEAIQCDLCNNWIHAQCEGVSKDMYDNLNLVFAGLSNISYYCEFNHCNSRVRQLISSYFKERIEAEPKQIETASIENRIHTMQESLQATINHLASKVDALHSVNIQDTVKSIQDHLSPQYNQLEKSVSDLSVKINELSTQEINLKKQIEDSSSAISAAKVAMEKPVTTSIDPTLRAMEEMADRERRKNNVVIYNLKEGGNHEADKDSVSVLLNSILDCQLNVTKLFRLGSKSHKDRPLLIGFECEEFKTKVLAAAPKLRSSTQFPNVYISHDRTKSEQQHHKALVVELLQRRNRGEQNLVIRNGKIITRRPKPPSSSNTSSTTREVTNEVPTSMDSSS